MRSKPRCKLVGLLCMMLMFAGRPASGQDLEPRSYTNLPVGLHFAGVGITRSDGDLAPTPSSPLQDAELTIDVATLAYANSFALAGNSAQFSVGGGRTCYEGSAIFDGEFVEGRRCEYTDLRMRVAWNFYGAPALSLKEFMAWKPGLVIGTSIQVSAPVGTYDSDNLINAGSNRWMLRPGIGLSYRNGPWAYELMGSVRLFEDNDDFFGGNDLEQKPLWSLQGHLIYNFPRGIWVSLNANFYRGGETVLNDVDQDNYVENSRWGATFSLPLGQRHSLKLYASTGVVTRTGSDFDTLGIGYLYRF